MNKKIWLVILLFVNIAWGNAQIKISNHAQEKQIEFGNDKIKFTVDYNNKCVVTSILVNGEEVLSNQTGIYSKVKIKGGSTYTTHHLKIAPNVTIKKNQVIFSKLELGDSNASIDETWTFNIGDSIIDMHIDRKVAKTIAVEEVGFPSVNFKNIHTWNGAFLDFGGLAWFYLFNTELCTYGVHSAATTFWNSTKDNALRVAATASNQKVVSKFTRSLNNELEYALTVSNEQVPYKYDSLTQRRRYISGHDDVWAPFTLHAGNYSENIQFSWVNYNKKYGRGTFTGVDGKQVSNLLNTIARIGVIDKQHFGGNSWHTPYGPICLHEQYIAQMGVGINDPDYMNGDKDCLDFYRDHAIQPDGRVIARWAYSNEDAMQGTVTPEGFYEAQWGYLMDSNPDFVTNVSDLYQQCGDINWVRKHKQGCEKALDYMLKRDSNGNHLVEMKNSSLTEQKSSDWIDIVWASYENAFVNAKLYHALMLWSAIEEQLGDHDKSMYYTNFAAQLKISFNKPIEEGGFWDSKNKWYVYWREKDGSIHGNNLVIPINFMAISYGICDNEKNIAAILDKVEKQMTQENLFFWPLCMYPYQKEEVKDYQIPFPEYENGDIFLSWGSIGIDAYAKYNPALALKYVNNVLKQYEKDGLAFQRYQRNGQVGAGDDILSGNALSIVGLYRSIYGINPQYNRMFLDPHLTSALNGTSLFYNYRGEKLHITLSEEDYSISNSQFKIRASSAFGFNTKSNLLQYFSGNNEKPSLECQVSKDQKVSLEIKHWTKEEQQWKQCGSENKQVINYSLNGLLPNTNYTITIDGKQEHNLNSDANGGLKFSSKTRSTDVNIRCSSHSQILAQNFASPPDDVKPGVYWYFMDGWMNKDAMTKDLESMKKVGIRDVTFLEIDQGTPTIPDRKTDFFSSEWQESFVYMVHEAERLGINITLGVGPGWTGSGGPWVPIDESMRDLVYSDTTVVGNAATQTILLKQPVPRTPYFGEGVYTPALKKQAMAYYEDQLILAYPSPKGSEKIADILDKALYKRDPFSSGTVLPYYPINIGDSVRSTSSVDASQVINLTSLLQKDGSIQWKVPAGNWNILRMGMTNNGAITRPAPHAGLGFECDKFSQEAFLHHYNSFVGKLIEQAGISKQKQGGLKTLHMDSWEMGSQNWGPTFATQFKKRRGYDLTNYLPTFSGQIVNTKAISERFLWDVRLTAQELVIENNAKYAKSIAHSKGLKLSLEPYDLTPLSDMDLGAIADIPMCEFWNKGRGFNTTYSCIEVVSYAHVLGKSEVRSEAFTSNWGVEPYTSYPTVMKNQTDWAFAAGINKFFFHTFAHKALGDEYRPGMTMAGYGVHWDRGQTWWPMVSDYHQYVSRCSYLLHQGSTVADILYLSQDAAPCVFLAPKSALDGDDTIPDRKEYNFDACTPNMLEHLASVKNGKIVFPSGATYEVLVLPESKTMTPQLLIKLKSLIDQGAMVVAGKAPEASPSLTDYPQCDEQVKTMAAQLWGGNRLKIAPPNDALEDHGYPSFTFIANLLKQKAVYPDFLTDGSVRYTHRATDEAEIYFVSNKSASNLTSTCTFRATSASPELWNAESGARNTIDHFVKQKDQTVIKLSFAPYQSYFVIFPKYPTKEKLDPISFSTPTTVLAELNTPWSVTFDPRWGGPASTTFDKLIDWTSSSNSGIKYYSGIATYSNTFNLPQGINLQQEAISLDLGVVNNMARVSINGKEVGILWTAPWYIQVNKYLHPGINKVEIEVANLWANRLIGDEQLPDDGIKDGKFPDWFLNHTPRTSGRYTFSTFNFYKKDSPLLPSGLLGPVRIITSKK